MDESGELNGPSFIARGETAKVFEAVEAPFDSVSVLVDERVVRNDNLAGAVGGDDRLGIHCLARRPQGIAVIGFIGQNGLAHLPVKKRRSLRDVTNLASRHDKAQGATERIGQHVDLGGQSPSGTPQRLILAPPFPLAAC